MVLYRVIKIAFGKKIKRKKILGACLVGVFGNCYLFLRTKKHIWEVKHPLFSLFSKFSKWFFSKNNTKMFSLFLYHLENKKSIMLSVFSIIVLVVLTCDIFSNTSFPLARDQGEFYLHKHISGFYYFQIFELFFLDLVLYSFILVPAMGILFLIRGFLLFLFSSFLVKQTNFYL